MIVVQYVHCAGSGVGGGGAGTAGRSVVIRSGHCPAADQGAAVGGGQEPQPRGDEQCPAPRPIFKTPPSRSHNAMGLLR